MVEPAKTPPTSSLKLHAMLEVVLSTSVRSSGSVAALVFLQGARMMITMMATNTHAIRMMAGTVTLVIAMKNNWVGVSEAAVGIPTEQGEKNHVFVVAL